ncbi:MAG: protein kinase domain-containing protein [Terriglobales bacterium]
MALAPGIRLGPYEITAALGAGGMGEVYRARDPRLGREVAIKILPAAMAQDARALQRMEQEARSVAALNHPNLLSVYDVGRTDDGRPYLVTELLEGESLRARLRSGALGTRKTVDLGVQIARGLAAAHDKGIVHRDLKPENIFLTNDGRAKILDFGLAKLAAVVSGEEVTAAGPAAAATAPGMVLGTIGYMAPEQVRGQAADARSDIFSLGAVLYEMLAGRRAFRGDSAADTMSAILKEEPDEISAPASGAAVPPGLERLVRHCLEKEPRQRFQSPDDVAYQLGEFSLGSNATSGGLATMAGPARRRWLWPAITAAAVIAAVAITWFARGGSSTVSLQTERLTYQNGPVDGAAFLPGDQAFIISAQFGGASQDELYTGQIGTPGLEPLGVSGEVVASVSKSGEILLLQQGPHYRNGGAGTLSEMPRTGGAPRPLLDHIAAACWNPAGTAYAIVRQDPATGGETLEYPPGHALAATSGWFDYPRFSLDGRNIALLDHPEPVDNLGYVAVVSLGGHLRRLTAIYNPAYSLAWAPSGRELWFTGHPNAGAATSSLSVFAVALSGAVHPLLSPVVPESSLEDVAADGAVLLNGENFRVSVRAFTPSAPQGRDLTVLSFAALGQLSPGGREALVGDFMITPGYATYLRSTAGGAPVRLGPGAPMALSPDGQWALSLVPTKLPQLELLPTGAGAARRLTHAQVDFSAARFLPGGRGIVAVGAAPGQPPRTYLVSLSGQVAALTPEGVVGDLPTPDGNHVLVQDAQNRWFLFPLAGGAPMPVAQLTSADQPLRFGVRAGQLFVADKGASGYGIVSLNLRTGQRTLLHTLAATGYVSFHTPEIAISRDGATYAYVYKQEAGTVYLVRGLH